MDIAFGYAHPNGKIKSKLVMIRTRRVMKKVEIIFCLWLALTFITAYMLLPAGLFIN
jgi:hypothetical protein